MLDYYIEPYAGLSFNHVLSIGPRHARPEMLLFTGAVAGAALRHAHVSIIGIEEILTALVILDMQGTERAVQLLGSDTEFLRNLRRGEAGNGIEHVIAIERLRQKITHLILQLDDVITTLSDVNHLFIYNIIQAAYFRILFADELLLLFNLQTLFRQGVRMEQKPFAMGVRIEHPQALISQSQYGKCWTHPALKAADYKLAVHTPDGRGTYTFCMCPGGEVIAAAAAALSAMRKALCSAGMAALPAELA